MAAESPGKPVFLLIPEWQGAAASRAMQLVDGASSLRADLPRSATIEVPVPSQAGDSLGTPVARLSSVLAARDRALEVLEAQGDRPAIALGCDCAGTLAGVERAAALHPGLVVLWFDAHADLQDPSTSPTGAAARMALRHALGGGAEELASRHPVDPSRVLLIGARELDAEEEAAVHDFGLEIGVASSAREWIAAAREDGATHLYVHIDLDVLDPAVFSSVHSPVPFGLDVEELTDAIREAVALLPLSGATIAGFAPPDEQFAGDDAPTVLRILAALAAGGSRTDRSDAREDPA